MTTTQQVIYERPPEGLARGRFFAPWWVVASVAGGIVLTAAIFLIVRFVVGARMARERGLTPLGSSGGPGEPRPPAGA